MKTVNTGLVLLTGLSALLLAALIALPYAGSAGTLVSDAIYLPVLFGSGTPVQARTLLISQRTDGAQGNGPSYAASLSADGRFVTFTSEAANLVDNDNNGVRDVFVTDRVSGATRLISRHTNGTLGNKMSFDSAISADGRFVVFNSMASNLVDSDTNDASDVFLHDRQSGQTSLVSRRQDGVQGNDWTGYAMLSADGRYVVALSKAANLVENDDNGQPDVFVFDLQTGDITLVSRHSDGTLSNGESWYPSLSADGRYVVFASQASNLVDDDDNGLYDVFVHDRQTGETELVSRRANGAQGNGESSTRSYAPTISTDGNLVVFFSDASNLVDNDNNCETDVFVHNRTTGETSIVSRSAAGQVGDHISLEATISANGRYVAYASAAANLVDGDANDTWDVFLHDLVAQETELVSVNSANEQGDRASFSPALSPNGRFVAFESEATNLVENHSGLDEDVFLRDRGS